MPPQTNTQKRVAKGMHCLKKYDKSIHTHSVYLQEFNACGKPIDFHSDIIL